MYRQFQGRPTVCIKFEKLLVYTNNPNTFPKQMAYVYVFFFNLRLLVTTRVSPTRYTTGYLQRLYKLIPFCQFALGISQSLGRDVLEFFLSFSLAPRNSSPALETKMSPRHLSLCHLCQKAFAEALFPLDLLLN